MVQLGHLASIHLVSPSHDFVVGGVREEAGMGERGLPLESVDPSFLSLTAECGGEGVSVHR